MRLGDVIESTERAEEAPDPPRRRARLWITLWLLVGLAAVSLVHGPIVLFPAEGEVIVLYTAESLGLLGPEVRVINDRPFAIRVPLAQNFARLPVAPRETAFEVEVDAAGTRLRVVGGVATHQVRPADARTVIGQLGVDPAARDRLVEALARKSHTEAIGALSLGALADPRQIDRALSAAAKALADEAAAFGIEVAVTTKPAAALDPEVSRLLARIGEAEERIAGQRGTTERDAVDRAETASALERRHRAELAALRARLDARRVEARRALDAARLRGEQIYTERVASARAEAATLLARARLVSSEATAEATAIKARITAIGDRGPQVLDHVIATHVMPQLRRLRTGAPPASAARWMPPGVAVEPLDGSIERSIDGAPIEAGSRAAPPDAPPLIVGPPAPEGLR